MRIIAKTSFIASTATPLIQITFDVYTNQHFEVLFTLKDDNSAKAVKANLNKIVKTLVLLKSELSQAEYFAFFNRLMITLDDYRTHLFNSDGMFESDLNDLSQMVKDAIATEEAKQAKKQAKK